jgi:hypothetical protein
MLDPAHADAGQLAHELAPALRVACDDRLRDIRWFRTDWQRGGAATGYAKFDHDAGERDVVVKLPVGPTELRTIVELAEDDHAPTPGVVAHGYELGGYDLGWLIMERLDGPPLMASLDKEALRDMAAAMGAVYKAAEARWSFKPPKDRPNWEKILEKSRATLRDNHVPSEQRWNEAVKHTQKILPILVRRWESRPINAWCHGDFHPGNALRRPEGSPWGPSGVILIDFAEVHCGHWVEDACYLERLYWGHSDQLCKQKPVSLLARARKAEQLDMEGDYQLLANTRRVLMAASAPAFLHREGRPAYLEAALGVIERLLPQVA